MENTINLTLDPFGTQVAAEAEKIAETALATEEKIKEALDSLGNFAEYGQVLRAKGIVEGEGGRWIHFDYVPGEAETREGTPEATGRICIIGVDLQKDRIKELFGLE